MSLDPIQGVYTALITPLDQDGNIHWEDFEKLLDHQAKGRVNGVVVCGTTGESPTVTVQEKLALIRKAKAFLPKSIKVMAGSGDNNTAQSVELSRLSIDAGADSLLVVTPPYNKPSLNGLLLHFQSIANISTRPICLYHVPGRTGQRLTPLEIARICEIENVVAVKEASGDLSLFSRTQNLTDANLLSGDDPSYLGSLAYGGQGVVSVVSNVFPGPMVEIYEAFNQGNHSRALAIHNSLLPFIDILFCEPNPGPLKAVLEHLGICKNFFRAPLVEVSSENQNRIIACYEDTLKRLQDCQDN